MTREEEIEKAVSCRYPLPPLYDEEQRRSKEYAESYNRAKDQQYAFIKGAKWADEHPFMEVILTDRRFILDKVCDWLKERAQYYWGDERDIECMIADFRKAMEN